MASATKKATRSAKATPKAKATKANGKAKAKVQPAKAPRHDNGPPKAKEVNGRRLTQLDATAIVLRKAKAPMTCAALVTAAAEQKLFESKAPTPAATLNASINGEIKANSKATPSRFERVDRGLYALSAHGRKASK